MNTVVLVGGLPRDPNFEYTRNDKAKCTFTLAVDRPVKAGEEKQADYPRIIVWGRQAETCGQYLRKGSQCAVLGEIRTGSYKKDDGTTVYTTDVLANRVEFLRGNRTGSSENAPMRAPLREPDMTAFNDMPDSFQASEDDIPF